MKADICGSETLAKKSAARGHPGLNQGPLDLQSNALPLSYIPYFHLLMHTFIFRHAELGRLSELRTLAL